jgi:hypothetical protein
VYPIEYRENPWTIIAQHSISYISVHICFGLHHRLLIGLLLQAPFRRRRAGAINEAMRHQSRLGGIGHSHFRLIKLNQLRSYINQA